jgi:hypothetical protein
MADLLCTPYKNEIRFALLCFALLCFALLCFALLCFALLCKKQCTTMNAIRNSFGINHIISENYLADLIDNWNQLSEAIVVQH